MEALSNLKQQCNTKRPEENSRGWGKGNTGGTRLGYPGMVSKGHETTDTATGFLSVHSLSSDENLRSNLEHFRTTRNDYVNPEEKNKAREHIVKTFKDFGLDTWTQEFPSNQAKYPGINVIGRVSGRYTGTSKDKIVIIGAHYDTEKGTKGVDDNGSGISTLLQALANYKSTNCNTDSPIKSNEETISSPSYPSEYPNGVNCSWVKKSEHPQMLEFVDFDLEESSNCTSDYVEVTTGATKERYCGSTKPQSISTSEKTVRVRFVSDAYVTKKGFKITWTTKGTTAGATRFYVRVV
ncbi:hypothetical protein QZH41_006422 [Actinostola sp. cb2023]|nr:hypothetical protein QZH41_006422 [Actinostola sp. cb2023]